MFYLQLKNELWKLFGKKRTYIGFGILLIAQNIMLLIFRFSKWSRNLTNLLEGNGYPSEHFISSMTVAMIMIYPLTFLLIPLYVTLIGGDLVAKEAEDGTLRMILSRPISRLRLLLVKWTAGAIFSLLLVVAFGIIGLAFASIWFSWGGLFMFIPGEMFSLFDPGTGFKRYVAAHLLMSIKACTLMGLGFMFSCFNVKPAAATILALSVLYANAVMQLIPFFKEYEIWLLSYHLNTVWMQILAQPVPWWRILESVCILFGYNITFLVIGCTVFQLRDIKS